MSHQCSEHCSIACPDKQQVSFCFLHSIRNVHVSCLCIVIHGRPLIVLADSCRHTCQLTHYSLSGSRSEHEGSSERFLYFSIWHKDTPIQLCVICLNSNSPLPFSLSLFPPIPPQCSRSPRTPAPVPSSQRSSRPCPTSSSATAVATCSPETTWPPKSGTSIWRASPWRPTRCVSHHMKCTREH